MPRFYRLPNTKLTGLQTSKEIPLLLTLTINSYGSVTKANGYKTLGLFSHITTFRTALGSIQPPTRTLSLVVELPEYSGDHSPLHTVCQCLEYVELNFTAGAGIAQWYNSTGPQAG